MSCLCLPRLQALASGLLPIAALRVALPPTLAGLALALPAPSPPGAAAGSLQAALRLGLPPLPLPAPQLLQIAALAQSVSQLALGLGIDLLAPQGPARLALMLRAAQRQLPQLSLPMALQAGLPAAMGLSLALGTLARCRATLGIDLLAPGAALALKAVLALPLPPPPSAAPALVARLAAYAQLSAAAQAFGGVPRLLPALALIAELKLPTLSLNPAPLATLSLLLGLRTQLQAVLGLDPQAPDLALRLNARLRPLWALPALPALAAGAPPAPAWPTLGASFAVQAQALAALPTARLAGLARLPLPSLASASLIASVAGAGELASADCCGP